VDRRSRSEPPSVHITRAGPERRCGVATPRCVRDARPEGRDAAARDGGRGIGWRDGAAVARRGWQRRYRCLPRAQPGPERSGGTRPHPRFLVPTAPAGMRAPSGCGCGASTSRGDGTGPSPLLHHAPSAGVRPASRSAGAPPASPTFRGERNPVFPGTVLDSSTRESHAEQQRSRRDWLFSAPLLLCMRHVLSIFIPEEALQRGMIPSPAEHLLQQRSHGEAE
jgi:hypothetical protein